MRRYALLLATALAATILAGGGSALIPATSAVAVTSAQAKVATSVTASDKTVATEIQPPNAKPICNANNGSICDWDGSGRMYTRSSGYTPTNLSYYDCCGNWFQIKIGNSSSGSSCVTWNASGGYFDVIGCQAGFPNYQQFTIPSDNGTFTLESRYTSLCLEYEGTYNYIGVHSCGNSTRWMN